MVGAALGVSELAIRSALMSTLLIVDDMPANLGVLVEHLEAAGYRVLVAQDAEEALQRASLMMPDLMLLDVLMPELDGFEACRRLKAMEKTRDIPVIFMTCLGEAADKLVGFEAGGVDYITKPFEIAEVLARIKTHLTLREARKELEAKNAELERAHEHLERRVRERTAELASSNAALKAEIAERQRVEAEREVLLAREQAARAELERTGRLKDEFLALLSHELRTPLTVILGWSQLLLARRASDELVRRGLTTIDRNARAQARLVDDLLDMSRIIGGRLSLEMEVVDLGKVLEAMVTSSEPAAKAKGIHLGLDVEPGEGLVLGDPNRIQQIVLNLLGNALKFTPQGGEVKVSLRREVSHAALTVSDTGIGIDATFLPHMFEQFRQADPSTTREHRGLGLGLSIVRHLVELHGGTVDAFSAGKNQGARFTVRLPLAAKQDKEGDLPPPSPRRILRYRGEELSELKGVRVLVVEDEPDTRDLILRILAERQAEVRTAGSVVEALAELGRDRPMVLVSDIGMPQEDGYALIQKVRQLPEERGGNVPALALTAFARAEDRARALRAGYQMHLAKPVIASDLIAGVATLAGRGTSGGGTSQEGHIGSA